MGCSHGRSIQEFSKPSKEIQKRVSEIIKRNEERRKGGQPVTYTALFDYEPERKAELSFRSGDGFSLVSATGDSDWIVCKDKSSRRTGYVPLSHLVKDSNESSLMTYPWWFEGSREEADLVLLQHYHGSTDGIYLVRQASDGTSYVLSVRTTDIDKRPCVHHYRIYGTPEEGFTYKQYFFQSMAELTDYFREDLGLGVLLTHAYSDVKPTPNMKDIEVRRSDIHIGRMIGAGYFGEVWEGDLHSKVKVAVKVVKNGSVSKDELLREASIMNKLRHRRLVQLLAVCSQKHQTLIVMEYMTNGALGSYLKMGTNTFKDYVSIALQIAEGMRFLESQNFIHRDLRAANILVAEEGEIKVADFGLARILTNGETYSVKKNTRLPVKWTAPEGIQYLKFTSKSDVWSFGVLLYEIITDGGDPYPGFTGPEVVKEVLAGYQMLRPNVSSEVGDAFYPLMEACWNMKPTRRPSFVWLHQHLFKLSSQFA